MKESRMTFQTLQPSKVIDVVKECLGEPTHTVTIDVPPVVASRPRVTRWGVYYGKKYTQWMKEADETLADALMTVSSPCSVVVDQIVQKPKTSKLTFPRGDVDNYAKAPLDAITKKGYWTDDDIITGLWTSKRFAEPDETPRTEVSIYVHKEEN